MALLNQRGLEPTTAPPDPNFPAWRHHAIYPSKLAKNQAELDALTAEGYGPTPLPAPISTTAEEAGLRQEYEGQMHDLAAKLDRAQTEYAVLAKKHTAMIARNQADTTVIELTAQVAALKKERDELNLQLAEQISLRRHAEAALKTHTDQPAVAPDAPAESIFETAAAARVADEEMQAKPEVSQDDAIKKVLDRRRKMSAPAPEPEPAF